MNIKTLFVIVLGACTLLSSCVKQNDTDYTYEENFDLLWELFDQRYCYFEEKNIDWDYVGNEYRNQLDTVTDDYMFFDLCCSMIDELEDGHTGISSGFNSHSFRSFYLDYPQNFDYTLLERNYLSPQWITAGGIRAKNIDGIGYLYYSSFMSFTGRTVLKNILTQLGPIDGLIFDVRNNTGGMLVMADTLASCFVVNDTILGYTRYKEGPGHNEFSDYFPYTIGLADSTDRVYDGHVVLLTNRMVYSAANTFSSLMSALPNVTLMGDTTGGGGGMPTGMELYNGWNIWMSTNPMYNVAKESIELGIAPDIRVDMASEDKLKGKDSMIEAAIAFLKEHK